MNKRTKWFVSVGMGVLILSLVFNLLSFRHTHGLNVGARAEFIQGAGSLSQGIHDYENGKNAAAQEQLTRGVYFLKASSYVMTQLGVTGVTGLGMYFDKAREYLLSDSNASQTQQGKHYEHVLEVFNSAFSPFYTMNYGSMNNSNLEQAVLKVYQAMTSQERSQYEGWGVV